jgi:hypothetical protein
MLDIIYCNTPSLPSPRTAASPKKKKPLAACWESPTQKIPPQQVARSSAEAAQNDMQIRAYCAISSFIYRHTLVLNLHSMCAAHIAHLGKTQLLFRFLIYCVHLTNCLWSSWFIPVTRLFIFCFFMKLVASFSHIYFCVYLYQHWFYFQTDSTALIHSMVLIRYGVISLLIFAVRLVKPSLALLRCGLLHIIFGFNFRLQFFSALALLFGVYTHLCFNL